MNTLTIYNERRFEYTNYINIAIISHMKSETSFSIELSKIANCNINLSNLQHVLEAILLILKQPHLEYVITINFTYTYSKDIETVNTCNYYYSLPENHTSWRYQDIIASMKRLFELNTVYKLIQARRDKFLELKNNS